MACIVMAYIVIAIYSYGLYSYDAGRRGVGSLTVAQLSALMSLHSDTSTCESVHASMHVDAITNMLT